MKLLLVDDSERVRDVIKRVVGSLCEEIYECADGDAALAAYNEFHPDWVLMDIQMQNINGLEATRRILAYDPQARIVIVTNYDDAHLRETARSIGARDYVLKEDLFALPLVLASRT
jgi:CheY-like chemotaxis protein